jgi:hypothetical protein
MPVWGVWLDDALWFSSSRRSRKAANLAGDPRCTVTTDDPREPVVLEGLADRIGDPSGRHAFLDAVVAKYAIDLPEDFVDPERNATFRVRWHWVFGLAESDFTGSPTVWELGASARLTGEASGDR